MFLTKTQAMKVGKREFSKVFVAELDGELKLASLSAGAALEFQAYQKRIKNGEDVNAEMLLSVVKAAVVEENGEPMFAGDDAGAKAFFDKISLASLYDIVLAVPSGVKKVGAAPGEALPGTQPGASLSGSVDTSVVPTPTISSST